MTKTSCKQSLLSISTIIMTLLLAIFIFPTAAQAEDPVGCFSNGVTLSITAYRADGTTPIGGGTIESGESVKYGATLSHAGGTNCNFEGGTLTITTPDGTPHVVASGAGVPLISSGSPFIAPQQTYVVTEADVDGGFLKAVAMYANGISHTPVTLQNAQAQVDISNPYLDRMLEVEKTAEPAIEANYRWEIEKTVTPAVWHLFDGETGTSEYTISLNKVESSSEFSVSGTITIYNPAKYASAHISDVSDMISGVGNATVNCPGGLSQELGPKEELICTYTASLPNSDLRTNTATVTTSGDVDGNSDDVSVNFAGVTPTDVSGAISVDDTYNAGDAGPFSESTEYTYERTFTCSEDEGSHENVATIVETGLSDSASVEVHCYNLSIEKTANATFGRKYDWMVEKVANATDVSIASEESYDINYTVTADVVGMSDHDWMVSGMITVHNPASMPATINSVEDVLSGIGNISVNCGTAVFPYTLSGKSSLECSYSKALPDGNERVNTAQAKQQLYNFDADGTHHLATTHTLSDDAVVMFSNPDTILDEQVTVTDSYAGNLGTVMASEAPKSFNYTRTVMFSEDECGVHTVENTATLVTNDTHTKSQASKTVYISVICPQGCTETSVYWRHYPERWPATSLMLGNHTYTKDELLSILNPPRSRTNNLNLLAQHLLTAKFNVLMGADDSDIADTIAAADELIGNNIIPPIGYGWVSSYQSLPLTSALARYNSGITGPGACNCLCLTDDSTDQSCSL